MVLLKKEKSFKDGDSNRVVMVHETMSNMNAIISFELYDYFVTHTLSIVNLGIGF